MKLIAIILGMVVLTSCSKEVEKSDPSTAERDDISGPVVRRIDEITTKIVMPSGQSILIYGKDGIAGVDVNLELPDNPLTKDKSVSLNFTLNPREYGNLLVGDRAGIQEYRILSPREIKKGKFSDSSELRNIKVEVPGMALPTR